MPAVMHVEAALVAASIESREVRDELADVLAPEHFEAENLALYWEAIRALHREGRRTDVVSIHAYLGARAEAFGGLVGLNTVVRAPHDRDLDAIRGYSTVVIDKWRLRKLVAACQSIAARAGGEVADPRAFIQESETLFLAATNSDSDDDGTLTLGEAIVKRVVEINQADGDPRDVITTGLCDVDALMGPIAMGEVVILAAHSGIGKTSLAMQIAGHVAEKCMVQGKWSGVYVSSQEMSWRQLADRTLAGLVKMNTRSIRRGLSPAQLTTIQGVAEGIQTNGTPLHSIWVDDRSAVRPEQLRQRVRRGARRLEQVGARLSLVVIDYLQLMDGTSDNPRVRNQTHEREVAGVSKQLLAIAKEMNCVILVLAQLNEDARTENRAPRGEDLSQCKALRHDAHRVIIIHNKAALERRTRDQDSVDGDERQREPEIVEIIVDKCRADAEGKRFALFDPTRSAFADLPREQLAQHLASLRQERESRDAAQASRGSGGKRK